MKNGRCFGCSPTLAAPSGRQGEMGPLLMSDRARKLAFRLADIGDDGAGAHLARKGAERPNGQGVWCRALAPGVARCAALVQEMELWRSCSQVCDSRPDGQARARACEGTGDHSA